LLNPILLGVNVDHVATVRQARGVGYPDPVHAALQAEMAGADGITMHLREDRRHIQDEDVERFASCTQTKLNFEMAATEEMLSIALRIKPLDVCVVPEKRAELTTEGGLNVANNLNALTELCGEFTDNNIRTSLFIDPDKDQIDATAKAGAPFIELHTGAYAEAKLPAAQQQEGHGLTRFNVAPVASIPDVHELNIGHSLIADSIFIGLPAAIKQLKQLMLEARQQTIQ